MFEKPYPIAMGLLLLALAVELGCEEAVRLDKNAGDQSDGDTDTDTDTDGDGDGDSDDDWVPPNVNAEGEVVQECSADCTAFPENPIVESDVPSNAASMFGEQGNFSTPGPCVSEPQLSEGDIPGTLFPANWLRPRFRFDPKSDENLFEIRLSAENQQHELVVYTTKTLWTMPIDIWSKLTKSTLDKPITVTIRGVDSDSPGKPSGIRGTFSIAPVVAEGKMVYWGTTSSKVTPDTSWLSGFAVGDESVIEALSLKTLNENDLEILNNDGADLRPASSEYGSDVGEAQCIGCHVSTPDGDAVSFNDHWPWNIIIASVEDEATAPVPVGAPPEYVTLGARRLLNQPWLGMQAFSKSFWTDDSKILVTTYGYPRTPEGYPEGDKGFDWQASDSQEKPENDVLAWFELQTDVDMEVPSDYTDYKAKLRNQLVDQAFGEGFGFIDMEGEDLSVCCPTWTRDGATIAYTAANNTQDGRLSTDNTDVDIHTVPYNDGAGGEVAQLEGACDPNTSEYYPTYSPDDKLIVFNREEDFTKTKTSSSVFGDFSIAGNDDVYYRPFAEVYIIPAEGGDPIRLVANDPPSCTGEESPGVINSWGKWSPDVNVSTNYGPDRSYYWVIFSSARSFPEQKLLEANQYSPPDMRSSQLYMAAIVRNEETGEYTTYPAVYLWNQEKESSNLTPAWDHFKIPQVPVI